MTPLPSLLSQRVNNTGGIPLVSPLCRPESSKNISLSSLCSVEEEGSNFLDAWRTSVKWLACPKIACRARLVQKSRTKTRFKVIFAFYCYSKAFVALCFGWFFLCHVKICNAHDTTKVSPTHPGRQSGQIYILSPERLQARDQQ